MRVFSSSVTTGKFRLLFGGALVAAASLLAASASHAALILVVNGTPLTDNAAGDSNPAVGQIVSTSTANGFLYSITASASNSPGSATNGAVQISLVGARNSGAANPATLTIGISDTSFTLPGSTGTPLVIAGAMSGSITGGAIGDGLTYQGATDPTNVQPPTAITSALQSFTKSTGIPVDTFSSTSPNTPFTHGATPYSLGGTLTVTLSPNAQITATGSTISSLAPEPGSIMVAACGLLGMGYRSRRRRA